MDCFSSKLLQFKFLPTLVLHDVEKLLSVPPWGSNSSIFKSSQIFPPVTLYKEDIGKGIYVGRTKVIQKMIFFRETMKTKIQEIKFGVEQT